MKESVFNQWFSLIIMSLIVTVISFLFLNFAISSYRQTNETLNQVEEAQERFHQEIEDFLE